MPVMDADLDCGNVIAAVQAHMQRAHGVRLPWMSWVADTVSPPSPATSQRLTRVYAHMIDGTAPEVHDAVWVSPASLDGDEARWVQMWQASTDEHGRQVRRSIGLAVHEGTQTLSGTYNAAGMCEGESWMCAEFNAHGALCTPVRKDSRTRQ